MSGRDFIYSFVKRNNLAGSIKASIAKLDEEDIRAFFDNLEATGDLDPANVFNYDETAVSDDLGRIFSSYKNWMEENPRQLQEGDSSLWCYSEADISSDVISALAANRKNFRAKLEIRIPCHRSASSEC